MLDKSNFFYHLIPAYVQEVRFSGGGLKSTRPMCIHLFSGGGQVSPGVSWGWQVYPGVWQVYLFFQQTKKSQVYLLGVARCISRFSRGGLKSTRPMCIHLFSGGARCRQVYPEGDRCIQGYDRCIFFFQRTKKSQVYLLGVARCISRFSEGGWLPLDVFRCILA